MRSLEVRTRELRGGRRVRGAVQVRTGELARGRGIRVAEHIGPYERARGAATLAPVAASRRGSVVVGPGELGRRTGTARDVAVLVSARCVRGALRYGRLLVAPTGALGTLRALRLVAAGAATGQLSARTARRRQLPAAVARARSTLREAVLAALVAAGATLSAAAGIRAEGTAETAALAGLARNTLTAGQRGTRTRADLAARRTGTGAEPPAGGRAAETCAGSAAEAGAVAAAGSTGTAVAGTAAESCGTALRGGTAPWPPPPGIPVEGFVPPWATSTGSMTSAVVPPESEGRSWIRMPCRRDRRPTTNRPMRRETETSTVGGDASRSLIAARSSGRGRCRCRGSRPERGRRAARDR